MRARWLAHLTSLSFAALIACGGGGSSYGSGPTPTPSPSPTPTPSPSSGSTITIQGMAFIPQSLQVAPGTVVTVHNLDTGMPHSVTSESAVDAFRPGAVAGVSFDTGPFQGSSSFTIPANAPVGTVIPYFCSVHLGTMATPNGEIRVVAPGTATASQPAPSPTTTPSPTPGNPY